MDTLIDSDDTGRGAQSAPALGIQLCGDFTIERLDGGPVEPLHGRQAALLLAFLATRPGRRATRNQIVDALWPQGGPADPAAAVSVLLSRLRRTLGAGCVEGRSAVTLVLPAGSRLDVELGTVAVEDAVQAAGEGRHDDLLLHARRVSLSLQSSFMPGAGDHGWVHRVRERVESALLRGLELTATAALALGPPYFGEGEAAARAAIERAPYYEPAHLALMALLRASDRAAEALVAYDGLRVRLREDLGSAPGPALAALHRELLKLSEPAPQDASRWELFMEFAFEGLDERAKVLVAQRAALLGAADRELLCAAAVLGATVTVRDLAVLTGSDDSAALAAVERAGEAVMGLLEAALRGL